MPIPIVTRAQFQQLAEVRLEEAKTLLDVGKWDGAYYLAGYAVELGLKACIVKMLMVTDAFPEKKFSANCYTHAIEDLIAVAGLKANWNMARATDSVLGGYWAIVGDWSEHARYNRIDEVEAKELYEAIADVNHGVMQWIRSQW